MVLKFKELEEANKLDKLLDDNAGERIILSALHPLRYKMLPKPLFKKLLTRFKTADQNQDPDEWYTGQPYYTFMDFFTRKLSKERRKEIIPTVRKSEIIVTNQCDIEAIGDFNDADKILRLKKHVKDINSDLKEFGIITSQYNYVDMKLLVSHYHRIHAPVTGRIKSTIPIEGKEDFFGGNSLWIVEFDTVVNKPIYLLLVGESLIQDFDFLVEKGDEVKIFDEIGFFNWGSQTVLLIPKEMMKDKEIKIAEGQKYYVGDTII